MTAKFKDHFSTQAAQYQRYRPSYPTDMFGWLVEQAPQHQLAWDCATGNGQAALSLAEHFAKVFASDASANQISQCQPHPHVEYKVASAEQAPLASNTVDLITVAQALHWFNQTAFFKEAWRVLKPNGKLAVWSYNLLSITPSIDAIVNHYYHDIVGPYWPAERRLVELGYAPFPSPFTEIPVPTFAMSAEWNMQDLLGYLGTWSASVYYAKVKQSDPLSHIQNELMQAWGEPQRHYPVLWPLHMRVGIKQTQA